MPRGLASAVKSHLEKAVAAAMAAVEIYNKPGTSFRTCHYLVLITLAWTALFHAVFYKRNTKPWYRKGARYERVDGDPKHWELSECLKQFYADKNPPERANLQFLLGLRNKVEHRNLPQIDPMLFGECQAALLNFETMLVAEFGERYSLAESVTLALQFSHVNDGAQKKAIQALLASAGNDIRLYVESFRASLPPEVLQSQAYSFSVFLIPKVANRQSAASMSVEFVQFDENKPAEMAGLQRLAAMIKERQVPVANVDTFKPSQVQQMVQARLPYKFNSFSHTVAWRHYEVRPDGWALKPEQTKTQYCIYDKVHNDYVYTKAWIEKLVAELSDPATYQLVTGQPAVELVKAEAAQ